MQALIAMEAEMADYIRDSSLHSELSSLEERLTRWHEQLEGARWDLPPRSYQKAYKKLEQMRIRLHALLLENEGMTSHSSFDIPPLQQLTVHELKQLKEGLFITLKHSRKLKTDLEKEYRQLQKTLFGPGKPRVLRKHLEKLKAPLQKMQKREQSVSSFLQTIETTENQLADEAPQLLKKVLTQQADLNRLSIEWNRQQELARNMEVWLKTQKGQLRNMPFQTAPTEQSLLDASQQLPSTARINQTLHMLAQARRYIERLLGKDNSPEKAHD